MARFFAPLAFTAALAAAPAFAAQAPEPAAPVAEAVGIVRSALPGRSVAILRCAGRTRVLAVGESACAARLVEIGSETVDVEVAGRRVQLRLAAPPAPSATRAPSPIALPAGAPPEDPATPFREMDRRQLQVRLGEEMNRILAETALAPVLEDGHVVGVQLNRLAEGSLLTDAGLRAGDVVKQINDTPIDGMATLIGLWPRLQSASELRAVVLRGGQPISLRIALR